MKVLLSCLSVCLSVLTQDSGSIYRFLVIFSHKVGTTNGSILLKDGFDFYLGQEIQNCFCKFLAIPSERGFVCSPALLMVC